MSNFEFQEESVTYKSREILGKPKVPGMANLMVKAKLAKDASHACKLMVVSSVVLILLAVVILVVFMGPEHAPIYQ